MKKNITSLAALSFSAICLLGAAQAHADCDQMGNAEWNQLSADMAAAYEKGEFNDALNYGKRMLIICNRSPVVNFTLSEIYRKMNNETESFNYAKRATEFITDYPVPHALAERMWLRRAEDELPYKKQLQELHMQLATGTGEIGGRHSQMKTSLYTAEMKLERERQRRLELLNSQIDILGVTKWIGAGTAIGGLVVAAVGAGIMGTKYGEASDKYGDVKDGDKRALKKFDENDAYVHAGIGLLAGGIGLGIAGSAVAIYSAVKQNNIRDSNPDVFDPDSVEPEITAPAASNTDIDFRFDVSPNSVVFGMTF